MDLSLLCKHICLLPPLLPPQKKNPPTNKQILCQRSSCDTCQSQEMHSMGLRGGPSSHLHPFLASARQGPQAERSRTQDGELRGPWLPGGRALPWALGQGRGGQGGEPSGDSQRPPLLGGRKRRLSLMLRLERHLSCPHGGPVPFSEVDRYCHLSGAFFFSRRKNVLSLFFFFN